MFTCIDCGLSLPLTEIHSWIRNSLEQLPYPPNGGRCVQTGWICCDCDWEQGSIVR